MNGRKNCSGCAHYRRIIGNEFGCNYFFDTNEFRNCPVEDCDKKETDPNKLLEFKQKSKEEFS